MNGESEAWRPSLGALVEEGGVRFRIWAPKPSTLELVVERDGVRRRMHPRPVEDGYWEHFEPGGRVGDRYGYLVDGSGPFPDPCSRRQPDGVHGLSEVVDLESFRWTDANWTTAPFEDLIIYEMHVGTFTSGGSFDSAAEDLNRLADLGVNAIELMPVGAFSGRWNWGYDGVALFAPFEGYGGPAVLQRLVDQAHQRGISVILDVVYNHFGPDGNYTGVYSDAYVNPESSTPWGPAMNFDRDGCEEVRKFYIENALQWLCAFRIDGLRLDATHAILDSSPRHFLAELSTVVRERSGRTVYLIAETNENDHRYVEPAEHGGHGFDAVWADDFHHAVRTSIQADHEGYYSGFEGLPSLERVLRRGWLYEGQFDPGFGRRRGGPAHIPRWGSLVYCLQNHDQVGNRAFADRIWRTANEAEVRAFSTLLLLLPETPMLFQGQEWGSHRPFLYFTDHGEHLADLIREGRRAEFAKFAAFSDPATRELIPDPQAPEAFEWSRLEAAEERDARSQLLESFHRSLIDLRSSDEVLRLFRQEKLPLDVSLQERCLSVKFAGRDGSRLLILNLERDATEFEIDDAQDAAVLFNSDDVQHGGFGRPAELLGHTLSVPGQSAVFLAF